VIEKAAFGTAAHLQHGSFLLNSAPPSWGARLCVISHEYTSLSLSIIMPVEAVGARVQPPEGLSAVVTGRLAAAHREDRAADRRKASCSLPNMALSKVHLRLVPGGLGGSIR
jgi:hypothetical protein